MLATVLRMAIHDSREVVIEATPEEIIEVIADVEALPEWSGPHQAAEIVDTGDDGRPRRVKMKVKTAGITDDMVLDYTFGDNTVSWTLVEGKQQRAQDATYTLTPEGDTTRVHFDITVDPTVSLPGFVMKRAMKGAMDEGTAGLRKRVLAKQKGR